MISTSKLHNLTQDYIKIKIESMQSIGYETLTCMSNLSCSLFVFGPWNNTKL